MAAAVYGFALPYERNKDAIATLNSAPSIPPIIFVKIEVEDIDGRLAMAHIGLYCPPEAGHLHTMLPLGQALQQRGHQVTYCGLLDAEPKIQAADLGFLSLAEQDFPRGSTQAIFDQVGKLKGLAALRLTMKWFTQSATSVLQDAPQRLRSAGIEVLIVDQLTPEGGTVADYLQIPFVTLCSALPVNQEPDIPPFFTNWTYQTNWWASLRNQAIYQLTNPFGAPLKQLRQQYRQAWQLPPETSFESPFAILSQQPAAFEYPRQHLPPWFHFTGPFHNQASRQAIDFPWNRLSSEQPLIYASMGTLQNRSVQIFQIIAAACASLDAQLVISLGGGSRPEALPPLVGDPIVVSYAPQLALLERAALAITHAGMNTALEALTYGVPMVAIPVTNDQPGVAARIAWTGAGERLPINQLNIGRLSQLLRLVFTEPSYRQNAERLQANIKMAGGANRAAHIIEQVIATGQPVLTP